MVEESFKSVVSEIKREIKSTQIKTIFEVNKNLILLYYRLGKILNDNFKYGNKFIEDVAREIKLEFPTLKGFSVRNLKYMKSFYLEYKDDNLVQQVVAQLPWGHNLLLMEKIKDKKNREKYINATIENGWSRSVLKFQIDTKYHLRIGNSSNNFADVLPLDKSDLVNNVIKDPYIFDFLTLKDSYNEKEFENKMIDRIKDVLLELGNGFSFVGNQYKITVDNKDYFIDLLFYHLKLRCYIVVELKVTKFIPEYVVKMNFYLSAVDDLIKSDNDNPSVGLILCKEKDKITANYSLKNINNPIGISSYKILPPNILKSLPTEEDLNFYINRIK